MIRGAIGALALLLAGATAASAATLDQIRQTKTVRIAYRTDAVPFSYKDSLGEPAGYSVELCRQLAKGLKQALGLDQLGVTYVEVGATDRLDAIAKGKADVLCEATTMTLGRMDQVSFSLGTFVTGGSLLYRADGPSTFEGLAGKKVGVLAGTTTEANLKRELQKAGIDAQIVEVKDHETGIDMLGKDTIQAYFADRAILVYLYLNSPARKQLKLATVTLSLEPYALALPKGDDAFRVQIDKLLARFYREGGGEDLFRASFPGAELPDIMRSLYLLNSLPD